MINKSIKFNDLFKVETGAAGSRVHGNLLHLKAVDHVG